MEPLSSAGNMDPMSTAGKHVTGVMRGKTWKPGQARENMQAVQARENMDPVSSAGKNKSGVKGGETCSRCRVREIGSELIRIDVDVAFDWMEIFSSGVCLHLLVTVLARVFASIIKLR